MEICFLDGHLPRLVVSSDLTKHGLDIKSVKKSLLPIRQLSSPLSVKLKISANQNTNRKVQNANSDNLLPPLFW